MFIDTFLLTPFKYPGNPDKILLKHIKIIHTHQGHDHAVGANKRTRLNTEINNNLIPIHYLPNTRLMLL